MTVMCDKGVVMSKYGKCVLDEEYRKRLKIMEKELQSTLGRKLYYRFFKRVADVFCSLIALVFLCVLFPFIAIAIRIDTPGPVIFSQVRVGQRGHLFKIYKFRTMVKDADEHRDEFHMDKEHPFIQRKNDPRVTRVGRVLRKYSIDELPQLFCVLSGKMSFIGPRPFVREEILALDEKYLVRLMLKPGLTGLAQISGRGKLSVDKRMEYDMEYIREMSAWLDIKILWKTIITVSTHDGAL